MDIRTDVCDPFREMGTDIRTDVRDPFREMGTDRTDVCDPFPVETFFPL